MTPKVKAPKVKAPKGKTAKAKSGAGIGGGVGGLSVAEILKRSIEAYKKEILALGASLPKPKEVIARLGKPGTLLQRLVDLRESPHASLDELFAVRGELAAELKERGVDPAEFGLRDMSELIVTLEEWAGSAYARVADFTSEELAHAARRETFLGHFVQHLLNRHRVIGPALLGLARDVAAVIREVAALGTEPFLTGRGTMVVPPKGQVGRPKRARNVEFWDGEKWAAATDDLFYSEHRDALTGELWGCHWLVEIEKKKGHVTTEQLRKRAARLAATPVVRWVDVETGELVHFVPERILVNTQPATRILMVADLPARYKTDDYMTFARMKGATGWEEYLRWDAKLKLDLVRNLYEMLR